MSESRPMVRRTAGHAASRAQAASASGDFETLWNDHLIFEIESMEVLRKRTRNRIVAGSTAMILSGVVLVYALHRFGFSGNLSILAVVLVVVGTASWCGWLYGKLRAQFKATMVAPLVRAFDSRLEYHPDETIDVEEFQASGLFRDLPVTEYSGEDFVRGKLGATGIRFSEVRAYHRERGRTRRGNRRARHIFTGLFFIADFNKHFRGSVYVLPDRAQRMLGALGQSLQGLSTRFGELVKLEDPEFERCFVVYGNDQLEARYVLSVSLMERLLRFREKSGHELRIGFVRSHLYMAIAVRRNLFEPRLFRSLADPALYREFWDDLALFTGIVDDLNLNTRIWSKA